MKNIWLKAALIFSIVAALIPWIWLSSTYGLQNIPHYDLVMWIFMELYALILLIVVGGILVIFGGSDEPQKKKPKKKSSAAQKKKSKTKAKKTRNNSTKTENNDEPEKPEADHPEEWDQREFE